MIMEKRQKHVSLSGPEPANFNRNELAIFGLPCAKVRELVNQINTLLHHQFKFAYADSSHQADDDTALQPNLPTLLELPGKANYLGFEYEQPAAQFQNKTLFAGYDMVLVNGNHFNANTQIAVINPGKPLDKKLDKLVNVKLILLAEGIVSAPSSFISSLSQDFEPEVLRLEDHAGICNFISNYITKRNPVLNGLVLAGGKSKRMQTDKGALAYFGKSQRLHVSALLNGYCGETYVSYADESVIEHSEQLPVITDSFVNLGPLGGILSAFRHNPNAAWLTVACDMPFLSATTIDFLIQNRNPQKAATCFVDSEGKYPEPLITIWEPRAYPVMLQFLSQGYSCPRKILINSNVEVLQAPDLNELQNINSPEERQQAMENLSKMV
jgi:molybdopterin-guanine dinucleotide biosynthesis protein A